jgi:hypothetical protein
MNVQIRGSSLSAEFYLIDGTTIVHFTIVKNQSDPNSSDVGNIFLLTMIYSL